MGKYLPGCLEITGLIQQLDQPLITPMGEDFPST
jgi:hypothetical protein